MTKKQRFLALLFIPILALLYFLPPILAIVKEGGQIIYYGYSPFGLLLLASNSSLYLIIGIIILSVVAIVPILILIGVIANKRGLIHVLTFVVLVLGCGVGIEGIIMSILYSIHNLAISIAPGIHTDDCYNIPIALVSTIIACSVTIPLLVSFKKNPVVKEEKPVSKGEVNKQGKFKRFLVNTKRVNSEKYCGVIYGDFGMGVKNAQFVNINDTNDGALLYNNEADDKILKKEDITILEFSNEKGWYQSGSVSGYDAVILVSTTSGYTGKFNAPIAKKGGEGVAKLTTDSINKLLDILGADFRLNYQLVRATGKLKDGKQFDFEIPIINKDDLYKKLKNQYPVGGVVIQPENLKGNF